MKIEIAKVADVLKRQELEPETLKAIITDLQGIVNAEIEAAEAEEKPPPMKRQFAILISDPAGVMPETDLVGWVVQIPEAASVLTIPERIHKAAYDFNASRRGRRNPVSTVGEACEAVAAKHFKDSEIAIKTKIPVSVIVTDNQIPRDEVYL